MESIIRDKVTKHIITNNLFTTYQYGFTAGKSCATQLLAALNCWTKSIDEEIQWTI